MKPAAPVTRKVRALGGIWAYNLVRCRSPFKPLYLPRAAASFREMQAEGRSDALPRVSVAFATDSKPQILALTSVRFFAALEVVLTHALFELGGDRVAAIPAALRELLTRGALAVS